MGRKCTFQGYFHHSFRADGYRLSRRLAGRRPAGRRRRALQERGTMRCRRTAETRCSTRGICRGRETPNSRDCWQRSRRRRQATRWMARKQIAVRTIWRHNGTRPQKRRDPKMPLRSRGITAAKPPLRPRSGRLGGKGPGCQCGGCRRHVGGGTARSAVARLSHTGARRR